MATAEGIVKEDAAGDWHEGVRLSGSPERERFVLAHAPMVRYIAQRIVSRVPASVELSDLINDGIVGLIEAIERFDPSRGVRFRSFAESRVRGAILDSLRERDPASRSLRRKIREMDSAAVRVEQRLGRAPGQDELAQEMGVTTEDVATLLRKRESATQVSTDPRIVEATAESGMTSGAPGPYEEVLESELQERLVEQIAQLPPRERLILGLYYEEALTMKEIGAVLNVTESRVCQIHARIVGELRRRMNSPAMVGAGGPGGS